jgi:uncharacterized phage protein gp47/JayE
MSSLYDDMTFEAVLSRMLERIPDDVDKREGSVIYDALAPAALELAQFYSALGNVIDETFADSAGREMLIRRAAERGIVPFPATYAVVHGAFDVFVPVGTRFSLSDGGELRYRLIENNQLVCEAIGAVGNRSVGDLIPVDFVEGLTSAKIIRIVTPGEDEEDTERLRRRYFDSLETQSYGGNISDYKKMALAIQGVGGVKVEPAFQGGGSVKLIIQDYQWGVASSSLTAQAQEIIDPVGHSGVGLGLAPIGHKVTVVPVIGFAINVSAKFSMVQGHTFNEVRAELESIIGEYLRELAAEWSHLNNVIVRASQIELRLLNHSSVLDVESLMLNGSASRNITLPADNIPIRGGVTNVS